MKKIKYGKVEVPDESFDEKQALVRVSMMLPLPLIKLLKELSLTEELGGKYQVLIRKVLTEWAKAELETLVKPRKKRA